ncbi:hypothetical protein CONCODRAFT_20311 [Conidiobolus coronatus NRRL 28638]|uniref:Transcription factor domain-containing protein n=1 Tax=Conidiobolus coronatus (strain ATCC 28846 / CBS 209.66 / NRRL 28638) TaxID=796925 RepID=A0A137NUK9_CONC2|nr:hypothetical protein CONCODRAFT_20311 [Conidiobolus coronatus NRRL 28638]|eukprot:KXN66294.1 hypothetical protein CONCODRAFT_20311 [Conidiobolus coronatus NRRL 28638]
MKYSKSSTTLTSVSDVTQRYIESKHNSKNLNDKRSLSLIQYTHKVDNIHNYEWSNFQKIEQLVNFFVYSNKIHITEFIYRWSVDLKTVPRIQSFIVNHNNSFEEVYKAKPQYYSVIARPLLLVLKESFWDSLIESYFIYFHPQCMLFNLVNFDPKTAPESLLSAIYFAGFLMQPNHHKEIISYMKTYAICNIKNILLTMKLSSVQALGIYAYGFYLNGNPSLSRLCLHHLLRIGHAIGISVNRRNIPELDQYNRKIAYSEMIFYSNWTKLGASKYKTFAEDDGAHVDTHDSKYQLPSLDIKLYNNYHERIIYSIFCCEFRKNHNQCVIVNNIICNYDSNTIVMETGELNMRNNEIFTKSKICLESMINLYPEYKDLISRYITFIKIPFFASSLSIYSKIIESPENIKFVTIETIINKCSESWKILSNNKNFIHIWSHGPFTVAFHLIKVYPHSTKMQHKTILIILRSIMDFYYKEGLDINSLNFLLLKSHVDLYKDRYI